jgi:hypothetical protein
MLDNSITLYSGDTGSGDALSLIDTDNGKTLRRRNGGGGIFQDLTISHDESLDKKSGITSDRHLVRIDHRFPDANQKEVTISNYIVSVYPRHGDVSNATVTANMHRLLSFLMGRQDIDAEALATLADRLYSGES